MWLHSGKFVRPELKKSASVDMSNTSVASSSTSSDEIRGNESENSPVISNAEPTLMSVRHDGVGHAHTGLNATHINTMGWLPYGLPPGYVPSMVTQGLHVPLYSTFQNPLYQNPYGMSNVSVSGVSDRKSVCNLNIPSVNIEITLILSLSTRSIYTPPISNPLSVTELLLLSVAPISSAAGVTDPSPSSLASYGLPPPPHPTLTPELHRASNPNPRTSSCFQPLLRRSLHRRSLRLKASVVLTLSLKMSRRGSRIVYVGNLPGDIREREVEDLFSKNCITLTKENVKGIIMILELVAERLKLREEGNN
ncbi:hypothetical protein Ahy_A01g004170 [Arachis hypogaea]|uniref:RRM domain-containing protein n=1 Tax=Arachis hypogaea TaxID=3818 RepID=A0A445EV08_ARAHY|nr:hypothetical protein Ahy_A01g004170 [Arachis hypogaea]